MLWHSIPLLKWQNSAKQLRMVQTLYVNVVYVNLIIYYYSFLLFICLIIYYSYDNLKWFAGVFRKINGKHPSA